MPRRKIPVPVDVADEMRRLNDHLQRSDREREIAKNTLRDYVTDAYLAGDGSFREIAAVLGVTGAWVAQLVGDTLEGRLASGEPGPRMSARERMLARDAAEVEAEIRNLG